MAARESRRRGRCSLRSRSRSAGGRGRLQGRGESPLASSIPRVGLDGRRSTSPSGRRAVSASARRDRGAAGRRQTAPARRSDRQPGGQRRELGPLFAHLLGAGAAAQARTARRRARPRPSARFAGDPTSMQAARHSRSQQLAASSSQPSQVAAASRRSSAAPGRSLPPRRRFLGDQARACRARPVDHARAQHRLVASSRSAPA